MRHHAPSLYCLPDLIAEVDAMNRWPGVIERSRMVRRYRKQEKAAWACVRNVSQGMRELAVEMVNDYLVRVVVGTRKDRRAAERRKEALWTGTK